MIDDDEELHPQWFARAAAEMQRPEIDFFAGPYHLDPDVVVPAWAMKLLECRGPLGFFEHADHDFEFTEDESRVSLGGNIAIRRAVLDRVGLYDTGLGRVGVGFAASEDEEMHGRLVAAGARGRYLHQLIIYHHCPPERQTRRYHRRWFFGVGHSQGKMLRKTGTDVVYLWRFPRYLILPSLNHLVTAPFNFRSELLLRRSLGYFWGCWQVPVPGPPRVSVSAQAAPLPDQA
jgi:GT2 family glycosyltransferase